MTAYIYIIIWIFILFVVCEVLQYQEWKDLEKKYLEEKRKNAKALNTIEELLRKLADVRSDLNQIKKQLEIKEQECLEANRRIKRIKESCCNEKHDKSINFVKCILLSAINNLNDSHGCEWDFYYEKLYKYLCDELESRWNK